jgi:hypothetical protein
VFDLSGIDYGLSLLNQLFITHRSILCTPLFNRNLTPGIIRRPA